MTHPSTYLAYAAWLAPVLWPLVLVVAWRERLPRKVPFIVVGILAGIGVVVLSMIPLGILLGWLNRAFGLDLRDQREIRVWFNGTLVFLFNLGVGYLAMVVLARWLGQDPRTSKQAENAG